jgi:hypothetical protein
VNTASLKTQKAGVEEVRDNNGVVIAVKGTGHIDGLDRQTLLFAKNCPGGGHGELTLRVMWTEEAAPNQ